MTERLYFKEGDVVAFSNIDGWYMKLINLGNQIHFKGDAAKIGITHVGIIKNFANDADGTACAIISEALGSGVVSSPYPLWWLNARVLDERIRVFRPRQQVNTISIYCEKYEGVPYDWASIVALGYSILTQRKIWYYESLKGPKTQFCSEFVLRVLYDASDGKIDLQKEFNRDFDMLMPMHFYYSDQFIRILPKN